MPIEIMIGHIKDFESFTLEEVDITQINEILADATEEKVNHSSIAAANLFRLLKNATEGRQRQLHSSETGIHQNGSIDHNDNSL